MDYSRRSYRHQVASGMSCFEVKIKETDLQVSVDSESFSQELVNFTEERILFYRTQLEEYLKLDPEFHSTLEPYLVSADAPPIALAMARAGNTAGVGPMAAVAGTFAELVGLDLRQRVKSVIVENGGDIFLQTTSSSRVAVFAGPSPLCNRLAVELAPRAKPYGICTSSGTVGPSLSFGRADAALIVSPSAPLSDAAATATANRIQTADDLTKALDFARSIVGVEGVLLIKDDKLAVWGNIKLAPVKI
ncbi:MAG: UPF0280 family protein [Dethiobacter sp.]|jgi:ApbE superfamily uncharacterized protein (UPF0280 family)|nr:UPF0280 family protein [Dethiobacter sp.]